MRRSERTFLPALREVDQVLTAPVTDKVRILYELEDDLESLRGLLLAQGLSAADARERAMATLLPDGPSLAALDEVHQPLYRRITRHLSEVRLRLVERALLAVAMGSVLLAEAFALLRVDVLARPSPFLWPVLGLGAVLAGTMGVTVFRVWIKQEVGAGWGTRPIAALAGAILAVGLGGTLADSYQLAATLQASPELAGPLTFDWLFRDGVLIAVSLLLAMAGGLAWFVLTAWATEVIHAHRSALGITHPKARFEEERT
jgi:hypothetical protein